MPPLTDTTDAELATATTLHHRAAETLDTAQAELRQAEIARDAARAQLEALRAVDADLRRRLAEAAAGLPGDAAALTDDVEVNLVALRAQGVAVAAAERAVVDARRHFQAAGTTLRDAETRRSAAQAAKDAADERAAMLAEVDAALGEDELGQVPGDAQAALDGDAFADAEARVAADLSEELLERARARLTIAGAEQDDALAAAAAAALKTADAATTQGGPASATEEARAMLASAEASYLTVLTGRTELDRAQAAIAAVNAAPPLSTDRKERMTEGPIADAGRDAAEAEKDRDDARDEVRAKRKDLQAKVLLAVTDHPDDDPAGDADVQAAQDDLDAAQGDLQKAEDALDVAADPDTPTPRQAFGRWEATVPDETWEALLALEEARATLTRLAGTDAAALEQTMSEAESAYGDAIAAESAAGRAVAVLRALTTDLAGAAETAARTTFDLSTARGDA